jgi:hypothetical protein
MDPWINSLVQSPLVRSLNTVPSRMSSFAYGVRDNVPPFSFVKEVVDRKSGGQALGWGESATKPSLETKFDFDIPESGLLDRMYLRVRMYSKDAGNTPRPALEHPEGVDADATRAQFLAKRDVNSRSNSMNFASILNSVTLRTSGNKTLHTLYPTAIAAEVQKMPSAQREFWYQCLNGFAATGTVPFTQLYNPYAEILSAPGTNFTSTVAGISTQHADADFLIPLPFAVLDQLKDNFQTRFVDDLSVAVELKDDPALTDYTDSTGTPGFRCSLVCMYHNFHDVIENSIRDQNFKRGFPASVYSHNYVREDQTFVSGKKLTFRFRNNNIISEMYCALKCVPGTGVKVHTAALPNRGDVGPFKFTLYGSGRQLWQAYSWELSGPDTADYQLADAHAYGEDLARPVLARRVVNGSIASATDLVSTATALTNAPLDVVTLGFQQLYCIRFGFQAHDSFYTGGLALQTISNPTLEIESLGSEPNPWIAPPDDTLRYGMDVILKTCQMLRIDSDTGVITTSLDV